MRLTIAYLAIFIMVLNFFAIFSNMLIHSHIYEYSLKIGIFLSALLVALCYLCMAKKNSAMNLFLKKRTIEENVKLILSVPIAIPLLVIPAISNGFPAALHFFNNVKGTAAVTISYKYQRRFSYCVYIKEFNTLILSPNFCFSEKVEWDGVTEGDILILDGTNSTWGFNFNEIKEVNKALQHQSLRSLDRI